MRQGQESPTSVGKPSKDLPHCTIPGRVKGRPRPSLLFHSLVGIHAIPLKAHNLEVIRRSINYPNDVNSMNFHRDPFIQVFSRLPGES